MFCLSLLFLLSLAGCCAGSDVLPKGPLYVGLGENVTINILHKKAPDDIVIWNFDDNNVATLRPSGVVVAESYKGRASINTTNGFLTVTGLTLQDTGDYSLNILPDGGTTITGGVTVHVLAPVSTVVINAVPAEVIEYNDTVVLNCTAKGSSLTFTWTNKSNTIVSDGKRVTVTHSLTQESSSSRVTISGVLRYDLVGPIVCTAQNQLGKASSDPFNSMVYYGPENVIIKPSAPSEFVPSKSNFTLTCSASSNPSATFTWFHDEKQITGTDPVLTLKAIEEQGLGKTAGNYKCVAQNAKTKRAVSSAPIKFSVMEPISGVKITGPSDILLADNSSASLSCQAKAGNVSSIVWLKDGKELSNSSHVIFSSDSSSISIKTLKKEDNGIFTCQLSNPVSKVEDTYPMVVNYGPDSAEVKTEPQVEVDSQMKITCAVASVPPATITWRLNDTVISGQTKKDLVIEKARYKDSGAYTCEAKNSVTGKTKTSTAVVVTVKEEIDEGLSDGAIAGIVIACLVAVGVAIALFFYCRGKVPSRSQSAHSYDVENSVSSPY